MKTPDEIKKGVEFCTTKFISGNLKTCDLDCSYRVEGVWCRNALSHDTLAYIQQLEAKAELVEQYRWERDVAIGQLEQLGIGFGEKVNGKFPRWISVEERLPELNTAVLAVMDDGIVFQELFAYDGWDLWEGCTGKITHWMPMPEPPEEV